MSLSAIAGVPAPAQSGSGSAGTAGAEGDGSFARVLQGETPASATQAASAPPRDADADAGSKRAETPAREDARKPSPTSSQTSKADDEKAADAAPAASAEAPVDKPEQAAAEGGWPPPGLASLLDPAALAMPAAAATTTPPTPAMATTADPAAGASPGNPAILRPGSPLLQGQADAGTNPASAAPAATAAAGASAPVATGTAPLADAGADLLKAAAAGRVDTASVTTAAAPDPAAGITPFALPQVAASLPATPSPTAPTLSNPNAPVPQLHGEAFADDIGTHVHWLAGQKIGHAHIRISPQELGPVEIRLQLDGDRISADFSSAQPEVRQALESSLPRLREMLGQNGFQLAHAGVGQQSRQEGNGGHGAATGGFDAGDGNGEAAAPVPTRLAVRGLLDAYA